MTGWCTNPSSWRAPPSAPGPGACVTAHGTKCKVTVQAYPPSVPCASRPSLHTRAVQCDHAGPRAPRPQAYPSQRPSAPWRSGRAASVSSILTPCSASFAGSMSSKCRTTGWSGPNMRPFATSGHSAYLRRRRSIGVRHLEMLQKGIAEGGFQTNCLPRGVIWICCTRGCRAGVKKNCCKVSAPLATCGRGMHACGMGAGGQSTRGAVAWSVPLADRPGAHACSMRPAE